MFDHSRSTAPEHGGDLKRVVLDELRLLRSSCLDEAMNDPVTQWRFDPVEAQRYARVLQGILGAVDVLNRGMTSGTFGTAGRP